MEEKEQKLDAVVSRLAYRKIVYHLLRYPTHKVYGALVGKQEGIIDDAYPLFHSPLLNPTLSVALDIVESNLEKGQKVLGFYESAEGGDLKMGTVIEANPALKNSTAIRAWNNQNECIVLGAKGFNLSYPPWNEIEQGLRSGDYRYLVDFDAHFEQVELDPINRHIKQA